MAILTSGPQSVLAAESVETNTLELWTRKTGSYSDNQNPDKQKPMTLDFRHLKLSRRRQFDAQYGKEMTYRGVPLADVLKTYKRQLHDDLALLHFANGMIVPVPMTDGGLSRLDGFVAAQVCEVKASCVSEFPEISKEDAFSVAGDPRPIRFSWNKLAVVTLWHPDVPEERQHIFSPWHHVDTLVGVEFANSAAYYRQYNFGAEPGELVFRARCQYCHGVRYVGARFGWDFVTPLPLFEKRPPDQLLNHVKYPKVRAKAMGLMMPPQGDVTPEEMRAIWQWMRTASTHKMQEYKP